VTPVGRRLAASGGLTLGAAAIAFGVGAPPERCPALTVPQVRDAAAAAAGWMIGNQQPDGTWLYEYDRVTDVESADYNIVRHAGLMSSLYQAEARGIDGALASADRGLEWILGNVVERHGWVGVTTNSTVQTGTNALLIAALVERRMITGDDAYDQLLDGLGAFLTSQVEPSGALLAYYDLGPDRPRPDTYSIYYTGEAYWALGRLHRLDPDAGWGAVADRMGQYMGTVRDDAEDIWPPLADHWSGYGLAETAAFPERTPGAPLTDVELAFVRRQGGLIGQRVRSIAQRFGPWGVLVRGTFTPRGGGYGVFGEGLTGLWRAAQLDDRLVDDRAALAERATCIVGLAIEAQADAADAVEYPDPGKVEGAWFIDDVTRMDDQQHALSALLLTVPLLEAAGTDHGGHTAPSALLWLVVVVAVVNPVRVALGTPARHDRWARVRIVAGGATAGAALLLAVGAVSGWLLGVADTSRPAMRLAAGGLCLLSAGIDLTTSGRRPTGDEPALPGRGAALVPVAVPLVVRPALVIAGLSVVADHGLGSYALALVVMVAGAVVAVAIAAGSTPEPTSGVARTITVWSGRLLSAAAVACSIVLIAHAVFDL
jgi:small neutral amino acid transporter SnatA (MarC family)